MNNLTMLRTKFGLSQKELAEILGVAQNTVSNWELGKRQISSEKLISIASLFKISVDDIIKTTQTQKAEQTQKTGQTQRAEQKHKAIFNQNAGIESILSCYEKLNDLGKSKASEIMQDLIEIPRYQKAKPITYRAARSNTKKSLPQKSIGKETIEKLKKAKEVKDENSLK